MKGATTNHDDEYLTTSIPVDLAFGLNDLSEEVFVNQIKVQTDGKVHHIIVKGCSDIIHKIQELDYTNKFGIFPETVIILVKARCEHLRSFLQRIEDSFFLGS